MKFDQFIEYNLRNIPLEKPYKKWDREIPDPFLKAQYSENIWINSPKFYIVCFYFTPSQGLSKNVETKTQTKLLLPHAKVCN